jgi:hypothetical protein
MSIGDEEYRVTTHEGQTVRIDVLASHIEVSDGHHTFGELYDHRRALTAALCRALSLDAWRSKAHHPEDSPMFEGGYFIVGVNLPTGPITYHYKLSHWDDFAGVIELEHAPRWDGAMPPVTVDRLLEWARA